MAERQTGNQQVLLGPETVVGTAVAATKRLRSIDITINPRGEVTTYKPQGSKLPTVVVSGQEWSGGSINGTPVYDEIVYPLAMIFGAPTVATSDTSAKTWPFVYTPGAALTPKTFTVEKGDSVRAGEAPGTHVTDFGLHITRNEITIDGSVMGLLYADGITMTGGTTLLPQVPILPKHVDLFIDPAFDDIGTTKYLRGFAFDLNMSGLYSPIWPLNSALTSYAVSVENSEPDITAELRVEADATGMAHLVKLRAGDTQYFRIVATSNVLAGAATAYYQLTIDFAAKIAEYTDFDDEDGVYVRPISLQLVDDEDLALEITVVNVTGAL